MRKIEVNREGEIITYIFDKEKEFRDGLTIGPRFVVSIVLNQVQGNIMPGLGFEDIKLYPDIIIDSFKIRQCTSILYELTPIKHNDTLGEVLEILNPKITKKDPGRETIPGRKIICA